jgi:hypothetical protein
MHQPLQADHYCWRCAEGRSHAPDAAASASTTASGSGQPPPLSLLNSRCPEAALVTSNDPARPEPSGLPSTIRLGKAASIASARAMNLHSTKQRRLFVTEFRAVGLHGLLLQPSAERYSVTAAMQRQQCHASHCLAPTNHCAGCSAAPDQCRSCLTTTL